jgi:hypothetical protein
VIGSLIAAVRFWWYGCAGYRLTPWKSPYLRWRVETYSGKPAASLRLKDFYKLFLAERGQIGSYLRWLGELRDLAREGK